MTTREMIAAVRASLHEQTLAFYVAGTTTSAGSVSTFICSALSGLANDFLNEKEVKFTSGANDGVRRRIADWVQSTQTATLRDQAPYTVASGVTFEVGESGFFSDQDILVWLNAASAQVIQFASDGALWDYLKTATTSGSQVTGKSYSRSAIPSDMAKLPVSVLVEDRTARILSSKARTRFIDDTYLGECVFFEGAEDDAATTVLYKPNQNATLTWQYVPTPDTITFTVNCNLPTRFHHAVVAWAIYEAWKSKERFDLAKVEQEKFFAIIGALNQSVRENVVKQNERNRQ